MKPNQIPNAGLRSQKRSRRTNEMPFAEIFHSGAFTYRLRWDWADLPQQLVGQQICGTCCDNRGNVYVSSRVKGAPIAVFRGDGSFIRFLGADLPTGRPHGLFIDSRDHIWLADDGVHVIFELDSSGSLIRTLGNYMQPSDTGVNTSSAVEHRLRFWTIKRLGAPFNRPTRIAEDSKGFYYASDGYGNAAIHKFSPDLQLVKTWGGMGSDPGKFGIPHSITVDPYDRILVADREFDRVQVFDSDGNLLRCLDNLLYPYDMVADGQYLYISEREGRVTIMDMDFQIVAQIGYFASPLNGHSIAADAQGNLYLGMLNGSYRLVKLQRIKEAETHVQ